MKRISEVMDESQWLKELTCESNLWGTCDHGVSLAPWIDCAACEVREDDADA